MPLPKSVYHSGPTHNITINLSKATTNTVYVWPEQRMVLSQLFRRYDMIIMYMYKLLDFMFTSAGIKNRFDHKRLLNSMKVCQVGGVKEICVRDKEFKTLDDMFSTRFDLYLKGWSPDNSSSLS